MDISSDIAGRDVHENVSSEHPIFIPDHGRAGHLVDCGNLRQWNLRPTRSGYQDLVDPVQIVTQLPRVADVDWVSCPTLDCRRDIFSLRSPT